MRTGSRASTKRKSGFNCTSRKTRTLNATTMRMSPGIAMKPMRFSSGSSSPLLDAKKWRRSRDQYHRSRSDRSTFDTPNSKSRMIRMSEAAQKKTPLYDEHVNRGAKMIPFGDWIMPVQYTGIMDEHQAVRKNVGMFDISHMGQLIVEGKGSGPWLNEMLTNNIDKLTVGAGQYTFLLNKHGGIIDDLIVYRIGDQKFLLVVNASRTEEDFAWLDRHLKEGRSPCSLKNRSEDFGGVAIQGPKVTELFIDLLENGRPARTELPTRNAIVDLTIEGMPISIARTGYTGEDGVEVFFRATDATKFWNLVLEKGQRFGIKPCGLGARDTLRLEMCYPLNGSDLSPERNPIEAGLGFFV